MENLVSNLTIPCTILAWTMAIIFPLMVVYAVVAFAKDSNG